MPISAGSKAMLLMLTFWFARGFDPLFGSKRDRASADLQIGD
jgi:hypothetical protein